MIFLEGFHFSNWRSSEEYANFVRSTTPIQALGLTVSICSALGLFIYAAFLHRKLTKRKAARYDPQRSNYGYFSSGGEFSRNRSGIMAARSDGDDQDSPYGAKRYNSSVAHGDLSYRKDPTSYARDHPSDGAFA